MGYTASQTGRRDPHTSTMEHKRPLPLHAEVSDLTTSTLSSPWGDVVPTRGAEWSQLRGRGQGIGDGEGHDAFPEHGA